jgi:hypothetical protein
MKANASAAIRIPAKFGNVMVFSLEIPCRHPGERRDGTVQSFKP